MVRSARPETSLSIGEVAERTGLSPATLRTWEIRHGFPRPVRLVSGHRRYAAGEVTVVRDVLRRRDGGLRLDVAIEQALGARVDVARSGHASVYAALRDGQPSLHPQRLRKSTLVGLSWALEDEFCARADGGRLFAAFQREQYWEPARSRWTELARRARSTHVFADFGSGGPEASLVRVPLAEDAAMRREWAIVCDAPRRAAALSAWEVPGQDDVPERHRIFEAVWTVDPVAVREAARTCAEVVADAGLDESGELLQALAGDVEDEVADLAFVTAMVNRVVAYVDHVPR